MKRACRRPLSESPTREEEMKRSVCKLRLGRLGTAIALVVLLTGLGSSPVEAKQPTNAAPLLGTWVNPKTAGGLAKVVITEWRFRGSSLWLLFANILRLGDASCFPVQQQCQFVNGHRVPGDH